MELTKSCLLFLTLLFLNLLSYQSLASQTTCNVASFGAKGDGHTDSTNALLAAWSRACESSNPATIYVPKGRYLIKTKALFRGEECKSNDITIRIDGTLVAPSDYRVLGDSANWIVFERVSGVKIIGGTLDAQGSALWKCKDSGNGCPMGATTLQFSNSNNILVIGLSSLNSQMFHMVIYNCNNVKLQSLKISAPGDSPNTDGIHVSSSSDISIFNSKISTGDDCISIGAGTNNLWIENIACGPGHGISIGSLGRDSQEEGVSNVTVNMVTFTGTQNGARIKTWGKPSTSFVNHVMFQHITMVNVENPVIINQNYCPDNKGCPNQASGVRISDVTYQDIHGSSATEVAVKFDCSEKFPCSGIKLRDVNLSYKNQNAEASCVNVDGTASGMIRPSSCL